MSEDDNISRRDFLRGVAAGAFTIATDRLPFTDTSESTAEEELTREELVDRLSHDITSPDRSNIDVQKTRELITEMGANMAETENLEYFEIKDDGNAIISARRNWSDFDHDDDIPNPGFRNETTQPISDERVSKVRGYQIEAEDETLSQLQETHGFDGSEVSPHMMAEIIDSYSNPDNLETPVITLKGKHTSGRRYASSYFSGRVNSTIDFNPDEFAEGVLDITLDTGSNEVSYTGKITLFAYRGSEYQKATILTSNSFVGAQNHLRISEPLDLEEIGPEGPVDAPSSSSEQSVVQYTTIESQPSSNMVVIMETMLESPVRGDSI